LKDVALSKPITKKDFVNNTFQLTKYNENFLLQFKDIKSQFKFKESIENIKKPTIIISYLKFKKIFKKMNLSEGSKKMLNIPNAGGSSLISETVQRAIGRQHV